jgi:hypothetical protein
MSKYITVICLTIISILELVLTKQLYWSIGLFFLYGIYKILIKL